MENLLIAWFHHYVWSDIHIADQDDNLYTENNCKVC